MKRTYFFAAIAGTATFYLLAQWVSSVPQLVLRQGSIVGKQVTLVVEAATGLRTFKQDHFLGIPYALPPRGQLRFRAPQPISDDPSARMEAKGYGPACMQTPGVRFHNRSEFSEDCLTVNIIRPAGISSYAALPVMVWIHGGAFTTGSGSLYDGSRLVARSVDLDRPIIYVSMNYRLQLFGFLAAPEVEERKDADLNVGLLDQRAALRWVNRNIASAGGDPDKVTIFGQSAGAISVGAQMLWNSGHVDLESPFRGAILQSGGAFGYHIPEPSIHEKAYLRFAENVGCITSAATDDSRKGPDAENRSIIDCLREAPVDTLFHEASRVEMEGLKDHYPGFSLYRPWGVVQDAGSYLRRVEHGGFYYARPSRILQDGNILKVPIMIGTNLDEGTTSSPVNIESDDELKKYIAGSLFYPYAAGLTSKWFEELSSLYPDIPSYGSPYANNVTDFDYDERLFTTSESSNRNQFKRIASIRGDLAFDSARRVQAEIMSRSVPVWTYQFRTPVKARKHLGVYHAAEIPYVFGQYAFQEDGDGIISQSMTEAWINFAYELDPNGNIPEPFWPKYSSQNRPLLEFRAHTVAVVKDDYRKEALEWMSFNEEWNYATGR